MSLILALVISGVATGAIYGLLGAGLVLTYRTSGIFNFGHGALATAAAYVFYWLHVTHGLDWELSFVLSVFVVGPVLGLGMELLSRNLSSQRTIWKVTGTVGLILIVQGLGTIKYGPDNIRVSQFLPKATETFRLGGVNVGYDDLTVFVISLFCVGGLFFLFRRTRLGLAMRAVVEDPDLLALQATDPVPVRRYAWIIGSTLAALSGVLILPYLGLEPIALTFLVVQAFGGAAIGFFSGIAMTYLGGILIGVLSAVSTHYVIDYSWLSGLPSALPFVILVAVLLVTPKRKLLPARLVEARPRIEWRGPEWSRLVAGGATLVFLVLVPSFAALKINFWTTALTEILLFASLGMLVRTAGMVSLCTTTFSAIGGTAFSQLAVDHGMPWFLALLIAGLIAVPVGALVAIPAIRLTGLFLALATFGFALLVQDLFYARNFMFTTFSSGRPVPRPVIAETDTGYYYLVLVIVLVGVLFTVGIHASRLGRILRGLGESPTAISTLGLSANVTRVIVFCISSFLAAIAGVLYSGQVGFATGGDGYFQPFTSLILLATLALTTIREPWYAPLAATAAIVPGYITGTNTTYWLNVIFGVLAIQVALGGGIYLLPARVQTAMQRVTDRMGARLPAAAQTLLLKWASRRDAPAPSDMPAAVAPATGASARSGSPHPSTAATHGAGGLEVRGLTVRFGGLTAVDGVSLHAPLNRITGLIGPNGAGKTTTFNACSGLVRRSAGYVSLHGDDVSDLAAPARARKGLGRTFQIMQLCESLTVLENVALGRESGQAGLNPVTHVVSRPSERRARQDATHEALELCGLTQLAHRQAGALSTGQRRLVELARCLAGSFDVLLLDEPSSGLDRSETVRFGSVLQEVVQARGCAVLLVEHDMSLVMSSCEHIYVLDSGRLIADGSPSDIAASVEVQTAYLGAEPDAALGALS